MLEIKALASGEEPTSDELSDGLTRLQGVVDGLFNPAPLTEVEITGDTTLDANTRAIHQASSPPTLTLPESPVNGDQIQIVGKSDGFATVNIQLDGNGRAIQETTLDDAPPRRFVYVSDTGTWVKASPLEADDDLALGDDEFVTLELAKRLIPLFGGSMTPESQGALVRASNRMRARFRQQVITPCDDAVQFLSRQSYSTGFEDQ